MRRNLRFVWLLIKLKMSHMMVFRLNFFGAFFADGMLFLVQLLTFNIIFGQVDSIGDWGRGEMLIFIGTFSMINGLNMLIYFFGVIGIPEKIQSGDLDHYLTKPVNPLFRITFEKVNLGSAPLLLLSGAIVAGAEASTGAGSSTASSLTGTASTRAASTGAASSAASGSAPTASGCSSIRSTNRIVNILLFLDIFTFSYSPFLFVGRVYSCLWPSTFPSFHFSFNTS